MDDTWILDLASYSWTRMEDAPHHCQGTVAAVHNHDVYLDNIYFQGTRMMVYDVERNTWLLLNVEPPTIRPDFQLNSTADQITQVLSPGLFQFGVGLDSGGSGMNRQSLKRQDGEPVGETWGYDIEEETWTRYEDMPAALSFSAAVWVEVDRRFVLFGGMKADSTLTNETWEFIPTGMSAIEHRGKLDRDLRLECIPNPIQNVTTIKFNIAKSTFATAKLFNLEGREVRRILEENRSAGENSATVITEDLPSGTYLLQLVTESDYATTGLILMR